MSGRKILNKSLKEFSQRQSRSKKKTLAEFLNQTATETLIRLYITFHLMAEAESQSHSKTDDTQKAVKLLLKMKHMVETEH